MTVTAERMTEIRALAHAKRRGMAAVRRKLRTGELTLGDVMAAQPAELNDVLLVDVLRWARRCGGKRVAEIVGREALRDQVNLMVPLGRASARSRAWVAEHGVRSWIRSAR